MKDTKIFKIFPDTCHYCLEKIESNEKNIILKIGLIPYNYHYCCLWHYIQFLKNYEVIKESSKVDKLLEMSKEDLLEEWEVARDQGIEKDFLNDIDIYCCEKIKKTLFAFLKKEFYCKLRAKNVIFQNCLKCEIINCNSAPHIIEINFSYKSKFGIQV